MTANNKRKNLSVLLRGMGGRNEWMECAKKEKKTRMKAIIQARLVYSHGAHHGAVQSSGEIEKGGIRTLLDWCFHYQRSPDIAIRFCRSVIEKVFINCIHSVWL